MVFIYYALYIKLNKKERNIKKRSKYAREANTICEHAVFHCPEDLRTLLLNRFVFSFNCQKKFGKLFKSQLPCIGQLFRIAEKEGFEPPVQSPEQRFSRPPH